MASLPMTVALAANTAQTITWDGGNSSEVEIVNSTTGTTAWARPGVTATVAGDECWPVIGGLEGRDVRCAVNGANNTASVSVICSAAATITVLPDC